MKIYMASNDWYGNVKYFLSRENAEAFRRQSFEKFKDDSFARHGGEAKDEDFYIEEYTVEDAPVVMDVMHAPLEVIGKANHVHDTSGVCRKNRYGELCKE